MNKIKITLVGISILLASVAWSATIYAGMMGGGHHGSGARHGGYNGYDGHHGGGYGDHHGDGAHHGEGYDDHHGGYADDMGPGRDRGDRSRDRHTGGTGTGHGPDHGDHHGDVFDNAPERAGGGRSR